MGIGNDRGSSPRSLTCVQPKAIGSRLATATAIRGVGSQHEREPRQAEHHGEQSPTATSRKSVCPGLAQRLPEQAEGAALFIVGHVIAEDHRELGAEDRRVRSRHEACDHWTRDELDEATQAEDPCHDFQAGHQRGRDRAPCRTW